MNTKVVFAGPSIFGLPWCWPSIELRAPAQFGDIFRAVQDGARVIGLIDGHYERVAATWHKEILFALSEGVQIYGGASMGALRAAECADFGMIPIGRIAHDYISGMLIDDGDVAVLNAPAEMSYRPLTEALVDAVATLQGLAATAMITEKEHQALVRQAELIFFKDRTPEELIRRALPPERRYGVLAAYQKHRVSLKHRDARMVVEAVDAASLEEIAPNWIFASSPFWEEAISRLG